MEFRTGTLTPAQMRDGVDNLVAFLRQRSKQDVFVSYGWGCDLDVDELYRDRPLALSSLNGFISRSEQDGVFMLGEAGLYIESADRAVQFVLCHEADVHATTKDANIAEQIGSAWADKGYPYYQVR